MSIELSGQVAIVTGGGRGIGRAIAKGLAGAGAAVTVTARSAGQLDETVSEIETAGGRAIAVPADVADEAAVRSVVAETEARLGPVDLLVNNAATEGPVGPIWEIEPEDWQRTFAVNVFGPFLYSRFVLPGMIERRRGRIINVSSGATTWTYGSAYTASKAALTRMTETMAGEAAPFGVQVFAINPGTVRTEMLRAIVEDPGMEKWAPGRAERLWQRDGPVDAPALLCLKLAFGMADGLSGAFLSARDNIEELVLRAEAIQKRELFRLRVNREYVG